MRLVSSCLAVAVTLALAGCGSEPEPAARIDNSQALARTFSILRAGTPEQPSVLRVLFYGQSISSPKWTDAAVEWLRRTYPNTRFVTANMAIGGFGSHLLERAAERDVTEFYPDLVVFHVYGDHHAYERILKTIRSKTAAEVILQTDHVAEPVEPMCDEGLHLSLETPPGCKGRVLLKQNSWEQHMSGKVIPDYAAQYGLGLEDRRIGWNAYLQRHRLQPNALLADGLHPNDQGWRLMAALFERWFGNAEQRYRGGPRSDLVSSVPPPADPRIKTYQVTGNRIELIASGPLDGKVEVLVDGKKPQSIDGCWQVSRTSSIAGMAEWPALKRVETAPGFHRAETWTATLTGLDAAQDKFRFALAGAATGPGGEGSASEDFASPSGRVRIAAEDWVLPMAAELHGKRATDGFKVSWSTRFVCNDQPAINIGPGRVQVRHVIATGLANGVHEVRLRVAAQAVPLLGELRTYRPPLGD